MHAKCTESLASSNLASSLQSERVDEEAKRKMLEVLKRFQLFEGQDEERAFAAEPSDLGFLGELTVEDVEGMTTEELMAAIGPEALERFESDLQGNSAFVGEELKRWRPWWSPALEGPSGEGTLQGGRASIPDPLEELPSLDKLTKKRPPEMIWSNLVELIYLYIHLYRMYAGDIIDNSDAFTRDFLLLSKVLTSQQFAYPSVIHSLRAAEASVAIETETFLSEETKCLLLEDVICVFSSLEYVLSALADLQRAFEWRLKVDPHCFAAAKKLYFYNVWMADEILHDRELVATVLMSIIALISGYKSKLGAATSGGELGLGPDALTLSTPSPGLENDQE